MADQEFDDDFDFDLPTAPVASHSTVNRANDQGDDSIHKGWTAIYPIYFDAKKKFGNGARRVNYEKASLFPQSLHIANVAHRMGWKIVHEVHKTHPQDWENPGRVKVCMDDLVNGISGKRALINSLALGVQSFSGKPPPLPKVLSKKEKKQEALQQQQSETDQESTTKSKGSDSKKSKSKSKTESSGPKNPVLARNKLLSYPDVKDRLPPHSPAQEGGMISGDGSGGMGGMGGMMGGMMNAMMGGDDDDDEDGKKGIKEKEETEEERKKREWEELQRKEREKYGMGGRRGRKKMVRVGRG